MNQINWQPGVTLYDIEKRIIKRALEFYGNQKKAALALGVAEKTIFNKLKRYEKEEAKIEQEKVAKIEQQKINLQRARGGLPVEPNDEFPSESLMPMQQRKEVQEVSHEPDTESSLPEGR
jgi:hypothetical protein